MDSALSLVFAIFYAKTASAKACPNFDELSRVERSRMGPNPQISKIRLWRNQLKRAEPFRFGHLDGGDEGLGQSKYLQRTLKPSAAKSCFLYI